MKVTYNPDNTVTIKATETEYNAIAFAVVNMVNTTNGEAQRHCKAILDEMEKALQKKMKQHQPPRPRAKNERR